MSPATPLGYAGSISKSPPSEDLVGQLLERSADAVAVLNADGLIRYVSPGVRRILGFAPEELVGKLPSEVADPRILEPIMSNLEDVAREAGASRTFETEAMAKDGTELWLEITFTNLLHEPIVNGVVANFRDISERKRAEKALRRSEERFRNIFEAAPVGIGLVDLEGRTIQTNRVVQEMLGYTDEEFAHMTFDSFTHPEDIAANIELFDEMVDGTRDFFQMEKRFIHKSGSIVWANLVVSLIRDLDGSPAYALGMVENITRRKTLEDQLRQAQKMEAVGRLAGGIAHDFNNLLAVIMNCATFLAQSLDEDDPRLQDVKDIRASGERGANLVRQLLAFSRKEIVSPEVVDLNEIVDSMQSLLGRTLGEDIELDVVVCAEPCLTKVDPGQLEQVIVNLAVNARDAMPNGGTITITTDNVTVGEDFARLHPGMEPESYVRLTMTDTGTGMNEEVLRHIFEPFFTTKARGQGTGLGLATVYGAVKQARGYISAYSEEGRGSMFSVYLPRTTDKAPSSASTVATPGSDRGHETVLLVEDDDSLRRLIRRMLERNGFTVIEAPNPSEGAQLFRANADRIAITVTDVVMPGASGKDLVSTIRDIDPSARVLYMSGYPEDVIAHHGVLEEGVPFIGKPFQEETLLKRLRAALDAA
jgi:two-component system, cell cycle sensor histidine kinase and response regulator CckA